ncbi:MAG: methyltransferase domain-containing protein [Planctomycetaceae bacterium]|nr:methyltransferase domain-containing protein [Planctomycetaceae bacterium]
MIAREYTKFISEFVCHPRAVGAVAPSSSNLARHLVESVDWPHTSNVVEYGPGTGSITEEILCQLPSDTTFLAIEISPRFAEMLRMRFPGIRVCEGSVSQVKEHCACHGIEQVDAIVSGLPWASFADEDQTAYLDATMEVLRRGGQFITYGYLQGRLLPAGRRFRHKLNQYFSEVRVSKPVWANLPPAFFYLCRR